MLLILIIQHLLTLFLAHLKKKFQFCSTKSREGIVVYIPQQYLKIIHH